jgi:acetyl-CoA acetyltransferase
LSRLPPAFKKDGSVTAGNASGMNDGASAVLVVSRSLADKLDAQRRWRVVGCVAVGVGRNRGSIATTSTRTAARSRFAKNSGRIAAENAWTYIRRI